ncbi:Radical SAM superfamily protein [Candidatus Terasakiella magnetica]|uniref:Heme chaperone HemW n=1 Tax=Candidatus Terasakiella magnetica TaxID=1867952 RepID=A0A1C3RGL0_9PROT|nr:radical SAM family heme chaperone HemW [Candidatus Terasakiella magnetica]SCA56436.1 Radical SAM superfamily protein [Candidatus Terasakiella magnetica]
MSSQPKTPFGLYIHWPYCVSKCPYCDFNSHVAKSVDHDQWAQAFINELTRIHQESAEQTISSIFFGGGTPSLMAPQTVESILQTAQKLWGFSPDIEITLEANPTTVETDTFANFKSAGINRLSIGIQSLRAKALTFLGRAHSLEEGFRALELAQKTFDRYSFDLIYARPDQTLQDWQDELTEALNLSAGHLSLYQLTIEPGTAFYKEGVPSVDEDLGADLFDLTQEMMEKAHMPAYEISNHAKSAQESRHNLIYWQGDDYIGIGPGAHSRLSNQAIHQIYQPDLWLNAIAEKKSGEQKRKSIPTEERIIELIMMGLRLKEGIDCAHFKSLTHQGLKDCLEPEGLEILIENGLVCWTETHLRASPEGRKCLNGVIEKLILV